MSKQVKKANSKFLRGVEIDDAADNLSFVKKQKRKPNTGLSQLQLKEIHPLTESQGKVFSAFKNGKNILCSGSAGTGKSAILLYLCLGELLYTQQYEKIIIYRTAKQVRDIGFTPGTDKEKIAVYSNGIKSLCSELMLRGDAYEILEKKDLIEFVSTSFARSITHNNSLVIFEEAQSATLNEISMVATRIGENSRLFLSADYSQNDLNSRVEKSGLLDFTEIAKLMESFEIVTFSIDDCVRSGFCKEFLIAKDKLGL